MYKWRISFEKADFSDSLVYHTTVIVDHKDFIKITKLTKLEIMLFRYVLAEGTTVNDEKSFFKY